MCVNEIHVLYALHYVSCLSLFLQMLNLTLWTCRVISRVLKWLRVLNIYLHSRLGVHNQCTASSCDAPDLCLTSNVVSFTAHDEVKYDDSWYVVGQKF